MATFYFNGAADIAAELPNNWQTLGNWWMSYNAGTNTHSVPATSLPTSTDSIEVRASIDTNTGSEPTVVNATFAWPGRISISMTATGLFTFYDSNVAGGPILNGDFICNGGTYVSTSTINGKGTFNDTSRTGTVTINGDCTFNDMSSGDWGFGTISGNCTFNDNSVSRDTITGDCTFNDSSYNEWNTITGDATFNDSSYNYNGTITGIARFRPSSATVMITGGYNGPYGSVEIIYDKGINGSSILGVV